MCLCNWNNDILVLQKSLLLNVYYILQVNATTYFAAINVNDKILLWKNEWKRRKQKLLKRYSQHYWGKYYGSNIQNWFSVGNLHCMFLNCD